VAGSHECCDEPSCYATMELIINGSLMEPSLGYMVGGPRQ
jgi:hypothetical protein